ncbi:putative lipoprotein [Myxococcus hansupus]|uniref:Putative lipoprotein n=1 Tax=Pseudomyxococcus hansupus TaxID=1297742 RepID=A0A0H4XGV3_9BACT|nr:hypothetical protein [Myxococcus hansupus]AKQ67462.1 putative lipoprotein [Myxococcus hansupus]
MKRLLFLSALAAAGCYTQETPQPDGVASFQVTLAGIYTGGTRTPLPVVNECATAHGGQALVPLEVRGTADCRLALPRTPVDFDVEILALDAKGQPMESFNGPVSFRTVPGNLMGEYRYRWTQLTNGRGTGTVRSGQLYGDTHVWVQDEAPQVDYANGQVVPGELPVEPATRTNSTGLSRLMKFEEPTIATVQVPQNSDQLTAYAGTYMRIGRNPEAGPPLLQNCPEGDPNDKQPVTLLVTGTDPGGFFVTDLTACRVREDSVPGANIQTGEPDGYYPGRFNSIYIYNYSFPEGLDPGDLLWSVSGSVQEFTATTQLTFPAWSVRERVRLLPQTEWTKYLDMAPPVEINGRLCGYSNSLYMTDPLCGYSYGNYKMESLESSLVKLTRVKFPTVFHNCDTNGNGSVPFFCPNTRAGTWGSCGTDNPNDPDIQERQCNIDCTLGIGQFAGVHCSERNTYNGFGQFTVEMNPSGPASAGLDESVPNRIQTFTVNVNADPTVVNWAQSDAFSRDQRVNVACDKPANVRFGATGTPVALAANTPLQHTMGAGQGIVYASVQNREDGTLTCKVAADARTRVNLVTKDAIPDLVPDCREDDPNAQAAQQCRYLHAASFDVVGHLRQVSAARPRWNLLPRDLDDICCYPGPGMECPQPIRNCVNP